MVATLMLNKTLSNLDQMKSHNFFNFVNRQLEYKCLQVTKSIIYCMYSKTVENNSYLIQYENNHTSNVAKQAGQVH